MPKITMTRNDLYHIDTQIVKIKNEQQAFALLLMYPIRKFYDSAGRELKITHERFKAISVKYIQTGEDGQLLTQENGEEKKYRFKNSVKDEDGIYVFGADKVEKLFDADIDKLMRQQIQIEW